MRLVFALAAALCLAAPAAAFDLTGTWVGKQTCGAFDGTTTKFKIPDSQLQITQVGSDIVMSVDGMEFYNAVGIDDTANPDRGHTYFAHCGTSSVPGSGGKDFDETGSATVKVKSNGDGTLKASSTFFNNTPEVAVCRWSYRRTSTTDPALVSPCAATTLVQPQ
jgi:hypothetical protein